MKRTVFVLLLAASAVSSQTLYMNIWVDGQATSIPIQDVRSLAVRSASGVNAQTQAETAVRSFILMQNFPNPFNPVTSIRYSLPAAGIASIRIFDAAGRTVRSFEIAHASAGCSTLDWDGRDEAGLAVSSGVYLCRVAFGGSVLSRRMVLIR